MLRYTTTAFESAIRLIETARKLKFGEICSIEVVYTGSPREVEVSRNEADLLNFLDENPCIDKLTVHQGEPVLAETNYESNGFRCRKKIKFPTERSEGRD